LENPIQNPTYEYYPPKTTGEWPRKLEILEWAYPFVLYPMAFQLPSGNVFLFVSNRSIIINPKTDEIYNTIPNLYEPTHLPFIYPYSPHMLMLPLTPKNKYSATLLLCGGSQLDAAGAVISSRQCFKINPEDPQPTWVKEDDMPYERVMLDGVILPGIICIFKFQMVKFFTSMEALGVWPVERKVGTQLLEEVQYLKPLFMILKRPLALDGLICQNPRLLVFITLALF
jgi:hypothetical protein